MRPPVLWALSRGACPDKWTDVALTPDAVPVSREGGSVLKRVAGGACPDNWPVSRPIHPYRVDHLVLEFLAIAHLIHKLSRLRVVLVLS